MKATHQGTCQICAAVHKVNAKWGTLANHGYTRPGGWCGNYNTCSGSREQPFEKSRAALEAHITEAEEQLIRMEDELHLEESRADGTWLVQYRNRRRYSLKTWVRHNDDGPVQEFPGDYTVDFNSRQKDRWQILRRSDISGLQKYLQDQRQRAESWVPRELSPVPAETKARVERKSFPKGDTSAAYQWCDQHKANGAKRTRVKRHPYGGNTEAVAWY